MTTSFATTLRRIATLPIIGLLAFTAACSDNSIAGPDVGNVRNSGYTVAADFTGPPTNGTNSTTTMKPTTTTTTTKSTKPNTSTNTGYTVTADALPPVNPTTFSSGK